MVLRFLTAWEGGRGKDEALEGAIIGLKKKLGRPRKKETKEDDEDIYWDRFKEGAHSRAVGGDGKKD